MKPPPGGLPHGGLRGQPEGRPSAFPRLRGAAGGDRHPRLQLLERLVPPGPAAGGGGGAAEPGQAHRGGPGASGEEELGPDGQGRLPQEAAGAEGGRLQPPEQPAAGQGRPGEEVRGQQGRVEGAAGSRGRREGPPAPCGMALPGGGTLGPVSLQRLQPEGGISPRRHWFLELVRWLWLPSGHLPYAGVSEGIPERAENV